MLTIIYSVDGGGCEIRTHAPVKANGFQVFYSVPNLADFERLYRKMKDARKVRRGKALRRF